MQTMESGKHVILPVAGAILDHARMPVTSPRQSHADMRRDGSTTAQTVLNPPSMSAEDCTAHQDSRPGDGSARRRAASHNSASSDTLATRRRRWPEREQRPRLRRQDKSAASGRAHLVGQIGFFGALASPSGSARRRFASEFNMRSACATRSGDATAWSRVRMRSGQAWPHPSGSPRRQAAEQLCLRGHGCREEGWSYREGVRPRGSR